VPAKRRQAVQEPDHPRLLPHHVDGNHWRTIHQHVDRTVPDRLVRNLTATSDGRVPGLDVVVHPYSTAPSRSRHNRKVRPVSNIMTRGGTGKEAIDTNREGDQIDGVVLSLTPDVEYRTSSPNVPPPCPL
jgi:hypothetical protein